MEKFYSKQLSRWTDKFGISKLEIETPGQVSKKQTTLQDMIDQRARERDARDRQLMETFGARKYTFSLRKD
jgi:hypothetical protein